MNSVVKLMPKYDHRQHVLPDWLVELKRRFQIGEVASDANRITWCQLLIGDTGAGILEGLEAEATWEQAKDRLLKQMGTGSVKDEAWAALKNLKRNGRDIVELARRSREAGQKDPSDRHRSSGAPCHRCIPGGTGSDTGHRSPKAGALAPGGCHCCRP